MESKEGGTELYNRSKKKSANKMQYWRGRKMEKMSVDKDKNMGGSRQATYTVRRRLGGKLDNTHAPALVCPMGRRSVS